MNRFDRLRVQLAEVIVGPLGDVLSFEDITGRQGARWDKKTKSIKSPPGSPQRAGTRLYPINHPTANWQWNPVTNKLDPSPQTSVAGHVRWR